MFYDNRLEIAPRLGRYVRASVDPESFLGAWAFDRGVAVLSDSGEERRLVIEGEITPLDYVRVIADATERGLAPAVVTLPRALASTMSFEKVREWNWYLKENPFPPVAQPQGIHLITHNNADKDIEKFLRTHAPHASVLPPHPEIRFWVVATDNERNIKATACGVVWSTGAAVVNSVAVAEDFRGQGLGKLVTRLAVQQHFAAGATSVSLGVWAQNQAAVGMYQAMGFDHEFNLTSTRLQPRESDPVHD
jgi:ribosomal protein S18 acetylase RimI-like enzyme